MSTTGYAGDITLQQTWEMLETRPDVHLLDVRTMAEWQWVGMPDLSSLAKQPLMVEWMTFPGGQVNAQFLAQFEAQNPPKDHTYVCLCRSGGRSMLAAQLLTSAGYTNCYNILHGFEGDKDGANHRNTTGGWRLAGLPWAQG